MIPSETQRRRVTRLTFIGASLLLLVAPTTTAQTRARILDENAVPIRGGGPDGAIVVRSVDAGIEVPVDPITGIPAGAPVCMPLVISKDFDSSTPPLLAALARGRELKELEITFFRRRSGGGAEAFFVIRLEGVRVLSLKSAREAGNGQTVERVSFAYLQYTYTHTDGALEYTASCFRSGNAP